MGMTGLSLIASCGHVVLGADGGSPAIEAELTAIEPSIANTGDVIALEGTFGETVTVEFPGGTLQPATVLGAHRAAVTVPATATDGDVTVMAGSSTLGPVRFRRASFAMGLGAFEDALEQPDGARQCATLATPRTSHTSVVIANYFYVLGGISKGLPLSTLEQAVIHADGSLGPPTTISGVTLVTARYAHTSAVIGHYLYVVGGFDGKTALTSVERAPINADGALGAFETVAGVTLAVARQGHTSAIIGNYLYVLGGAGGGGYLNSAERAVIHSDGSLDAFSTVPGVVLTTARGGHTSAVIGAHLYAVGGFDGNTALNTIEQATIHPDGSLDSFTMLSGVTLVTARNNHTSVVLGSQLYVLGGVGVAGASNSVEQATIQPDGSLGAFSTVPGATLTTASSGHTSTVIGNYLYLVGGSNNSGPNGIARSQIDADGLLGSFATVPVALVTARYGHTSAVIGNYLYLIGGFAGIARSKTVERAMINADGSLGPFATVPATLVAARYGATSAVIGNYLYVLGGNGGGSTVERAMIDATGSLGSFATVSGVTLVTSRFYHASAVIQNYLYIISGDADGALTNSVERAPINADGSLGPFTTVAGVTLVAARYAATSAVLGHYLYIIGGNTGGTERAMINPDGSLSAFTAVPSASLAVARFFHTSEVVGSYLYVVGGNAGTTERAAIHPDGSLDAFAALPGAALATQRFGHTSAVVGNYLYVLGGQAGSDTLNTVERATLTMDTH